MRQIEGGIKCNCYNFQVSWLRGSDLQVLSSGWDKFTADSRIRIFPADQTHSWTLSITNVTIKDTGAYLCQVNTEPKLTLRYFLTVEGMYYVFDLQIGRLESKIKYLF